MADNGSKEFRLTRNHSAFIYHRVSFDHRGKRARFGNVSDERQRNNVMRLCARVSTINAILHRVQRLTFTSQTFVPTCLIFQLIIFVRPRAYIEAARHNGEKRRLDGEQHLIYREILRSRHRETIHSGTTVTFQTRTAIVSVSRYRAGDWR